MRTPVSASRLALVIGALSLATLAPAPINDSSHRPKEWIAEQSQAQLAKEQRYNGVRSEVGRVPTDSDHRDANPEAGQPGAADAVAAASHSTEASAVIADASAKVDGKPERHGLPWYVLVGIVGGGVFAVSRGFKAWADKALPAPSHLR